MFFRKYKRYSSIRNIHRRKYNIKEGIKLSNVVKKIELTPIHVPFRSQVKKALEESEGGLGMAIPADEVWLGGDFVICKLFDNEGNISFGIAEYIDIPGVKYAPEIGIIGLEICIGLERAGYRIKRRRRVKRVVGKKHRITKEGAIDFMKKEFKVEVE